MSKLNDITLNLNRRECRILEKQYFSSQAINGRISTLGVLTRSMFRSPADRWNLIRYLLAAQKVFHWNMRRSDADSHQYNSTDKEHPGTWEALCTAWLQPKNLLTEEECQMLATYKGNRCNAIFSMYEQRLRISMAQKAEHHTSTGRADLKRAMVDHLLAIKTQMASILEVFTPRSIFIISNSIFKRRNWSHATRV
jgi:hypothetical protein